MRTKIFDQDWSKIDGGHETYGGLVDVGEDRLVSVWIYIVRGTNGVQKIDVELKWYDKELVASRHVGAYHLPELTEEEYDQVIEVTEGDGFPIEYTVIGYCIAKTLEKEQ